VTRHDTDIVSLVAGLLFLGVVGSWALEEVNVLPGSRGWLLPLVLVAAGLIGLVSARPGRRRKRGQASDTSTEFDW